MTEQAISAEGGEAMRETIDGAGGWGLLLDLYRRAT
jgi:hypothetical protein